ncbi:MAG: FAD-dependent oxidoreductase [Oscillospiraceae bacterium]|jgi:hypothetical protein|nr:FAD-dependent oxidoreductase [Oscillospiraceae bacterium]
MSKFITEPARELEVSRETEVLVAGGGIAGIAAAIAAARGGKRVTLLEREYMLGGMATLGLVTIYLPLCDGEGNQVVFGIAEELLKLSIAHGAEANYPAAWLDKTAAGKFTAAREERVRNRYLTQFNPHLFALRAEQLLLSLGVTILYGTLVCGVARDGDSISAVVIENKSGRSAIAVESVIDCTGDADVCALAGAEIALHANGNGLASWYYFISQGKVNLKMFGLADVAPNAAPSKPTDDTYKAVMTESLDKSVRFSGVNGAELSDAVIAAHAKMFEDIENRRASDESYLPVTVSTIPLVRMSRRLVGAYTLDESENRKPQPDSIGLTGDWRNRGPVFEIPFGTLHGKVRNLLAAGRDISVTDAMWDITRVIPPCAVTGEAAGTAAAIGNDFVKIDIKKLQNKLKNQGVRVKI